MTPRTRLFLIIAGTVATLGIVGGAFVIEDQRERARDALKSLMFDTPQGVCKVARTRVDGGCDLLVVPPPEVDGGALVWRNYSEFVACGAEAHACGESISCNCR